MKAMYAAGGAPPLAPVAGGVMNNNNNNNPLGVNPADKYVVVKYISKGSFGIARLVERKSDRAQLISKEIKLANMKPADREAAKNEVSMLRNMNHPNITRYVDHYEQAGSLFIVMEFANGGDLMTKIQSRRGVRFTEKEVMHFFCQIALALLYLHEKRILHRDLKTQNVFLTRDGVVKLGDFGISTVLRNTFELKKTVCGTPYYFSPELCLSKPYGNKSDVWALGCMLYELASLTHAFEGNNMKALVQKILKGVYPPIHGSYSADMQALIACMLRLDPAKRPNMHEIVQMPYVREHLAALQATAALANQDRRSLVDPAEKLRQQEEALLRMEEEKALRAKQQAEAKARQDQKEREHQQRVEQIRVQMAAEVQLHEEKLKRAKEQAQQQVKDQAAQEERRRLELIDKLRKQEADARQAEADRKSREAERAKRAAEERQRIEVDRKRWEEEKKKQDEERRARMSRDMALYKKREAEWEENMKQLQQQKAQQQQQVQQDVNSNNNNNNNNNNNDYANINARGAGADYKSLDDQARLAAYKEMKLQADANKRRLAEADAAPPQKRESPPVEPAIARKSPPVAPSGNVKPAAGGAVVDSEANRLAFLAMRREAEENRKRTVESDGILAAAAGKRPVVNPQQQQQQPQQVQQAQQQVFQNRIASPVTPVQPTSGFNTPANSIDDQTRRDVYFQMRREAEANRRRLLGQDDSPASPAPTPAPANSKQVEAPAPRPVAQLAAADPKQVQQQAAAAAPVAGPLNKEDIVLSESDDELDGEDGSAGLHRFLNADAMAAKDDEESSDEESKRAADAQGNNNNKNNNNDGNNNGNNNLDAEAALLSPSKQGVHQQRRQDYTDVTNCIADALDKSKHPSAPDDFADDADMVVDPFTFVVDGKELQLHGVQSSDPLGHRIETLRVFLEQCFECCAGVGLDFLRVYRALGKIEECASEEESERQLEELRKKLPEKQRQLYLPLVTQLIVCEDVFNMQQNHS